MYRKVQVLKIYLIQREKKFRGIFRTKNPTKDQIRKYKRREKELDHNSTAIFVYVQSDLMSRIKNCRGEKNIRFRCKLGFNLNDVIMYKEESVTIKIIKVFFRNEKKENERDEKLKKEAEVKDENKELKTKLRNLRTNQITNNFGKITRKN